jgi:hypothetical protein
MVRAATKTPAKKYKAPETDDDAVLTPTFRPSEADTREITQTLYTLVSKTSINSTICPSQIPRTLHANNPTHYKDWRSMMQPVREIVWGEVKKGIVEVTQGGVVRCWEERNGLKGPIRIRRGEKWEDRECCAVKEKD